MRVGHIITTEMEPISRTASRYVTTEENKERCIAKGESAKKKHPMYSYRSAAEINKIKGPHLI